MKRIIVVLFISILVVAAAACGIGAEGSTSSPSDESVGAADAAVSPETEPPRSEKDTGGPETAKVQNTPVAETEVTESDPDGSKGLVVYFSATGNTRQLAETIAEQTNAGIYEIVPEEPYTEDDLNYSDRSSRATQEQNDAAARPLISGNPGDLGEYDVVYLGYPIWWGDMPRIIYTFLDEYDLSGKTIAPFCTSGSSGLSGTPATIAEMEQKASVVEGLHVRGSNLSKASAAVQEWLSALPAQTDS